MGRSLPGKFFDIREGEGLRATLMFAYIFLVIASLMILKPVSNSLFLSHSGAAMLPRLFVLLATVAALAAALYARLARAMRMDVLIPATTAVSILALAGFRLLLRDGPEAPGPVLYAFYIWVTLFGGITGAQFWLLANDIFHAREAKRLFGFIGTGAIAGGIFGGYLTDTLAPRVRTENLLFPCMLFLAICFFLFAAVRRSAGAHYGPQERPRRRGLEAGTLRTLLHSRLFLYIAGITGMGVMVANLVDFQYRSIASATIRDTDDLTAFFGFWMSTANLLSLGVQTLLSGRVLKRLGVTASLFFLPSAIGLAAFSLLLWPGLAAAVLIRLSDGTFKHSIHKSGVELLFLPIPSAVKRRLRAVIDLFANNAATGIAGAFLLLLGAASIRSTPSISALILTLVAVWIFLILRVRRAYIAAFRSAIERRSIDLDRLTIHPEDASTLAGLREVLDGEDDRQILFVLQLLEDVHNPRLIPSIRRLVRHPVPEIASRAIAMAHRYPELDLTAEIGPLAGAAADDAVRVEAIHYLCGRADDMLGRLRGFRDDPDVHVRGTAMVCAARTWRENPRARGMIDLEAMIRGSLARAARGGNRAEAEFSRITAARTIGVSLDREIYPLLSRLLEDESPAVVCAAMESAGRTADPAFVPALIRRLAGERTHIGARRALAEYGHSAIGTLAERLADPETDAIVRRRIPGVLARIGSRRSADLLLGLLDTPDPSLRMRAIRALNRQQSCHPGLRLRAGPIESRARAEIETWHRLTRILAGLRRGLGTNRHRSGGEGPDGSREGTREGSGAMRGWRLLEMALREHRLDALERAFRLLALRYPGERMVNAFFGATSDRRRAHANAVEYLDNVLPTAWKRALIPIVEAGPEDAGRTGDVEKSVEGPGTNACIRLLIEGDDPWLRACALHVSAEMAWAGFRDVARALVTGPEPLAREVAGYYLEKIEERG